MAHQVAWSKVIVERFIEVGCLTKEEEEVLRTRVAGWTITEQADKLGMSVSKVNFLTKRLKSKYDAAQKYDPLLPPRKFSARETYQDSH